MDWTGFDLSCGVTAVAMSLPRESGGVFFSFLFSSVLLSLSLRLSWCASCSISDLVPAAVTPSMIYFDALVSRLHGVGVHE